MIIPEVQYNLTSLRTHFRQYAELSGKTEEQIVAKMSAELTWNLYGGLREIMPAKGSIRAEQEAALKAGRGVHVRDSILAEVAGKYGALTSIASGKTYLKQGRSMTTEITSKDGDYRLNLRALAVMRELNVRESARGFAAFAVPKPPAAWKNLSDSAVRLAELTKDSRYGFAVSSFKLSNQSERKYAVISWFGRRAGSYESAVEGLSKPKQQKILADAVAKTEANVVTYIMRKLAENRDRAALN